MRITAAVLHDANKPYSIDLDTDAVGRGVMVF